MIHQHIQELQHFARLGRMSASMLHEISNPLSAAMINLETGDQSSPAIREAKRDMKLLHRYVEAARQQIRTGSQLKSFSLQPQLNQLKRILLPLAKQAGIRLEFDSIPVGCKIYGDSVKFQQIVSNLVISAIQAYDKADAYAESSMVLVNLGITQKYLTVVVTDWGNGIALSDLPNIFEPFYTTNGNTGHGLGIGLNLVKQFVTTDFGGTIKVSSSKHNGTKFTIKFRLLPC